MPLNKPLEIGWEEWIALPELKLPAIRAKVDTGAKTSALHAFMVEKIQEGEDPKVRFGIHPIPDRPEIEVYCKAHLVDEREIISSSGQAELRYVIRTMAQFGKRKWPIEITLTDRETMAYRMLIGRSAMEGKLSVIPGRSFMLGTLSASAYSHITPRRQKKSLKIGILSNSRNNYSTNRLISVAEARGHKVEVINATRCYVDISTNKPAIHYQGHLLPRFDTVIPRIGSITTFYNVAILRQFESLGTHSINRSMAISHAADRLLAHQLLGRAGVAMPTTAFAHFPGDTKDMIKIVGGPPIVIKLLDGTTGKGIVLAQTYKAAVAVIQAFRRLNANFIAQEYIKDPRSKDILCCVLGNKIVTSIQTDSYDSETTASKRDGGSLINMTLGEKKLAVKAVRVLGLKFAQVNLVRTKEGAKIIDVDPSPKLKIMEMISGLDIAKMVVEYLEGHARPRLPKRMIGL